MQVAEVSGIGSIVIAAVDESLATRLRELVANAFGSDHTVDIVRPGVAGSLLWERPVLVAWSDAAPAAIRWILSQRRATTSAPLIAVVAEYSDEDAATALNSGADVCLSITVAPKLLRSSLLAIVRRNRGLGAGGERIAHVTQAFRRRLRPVEQAVWNYLIGNAGRWVTERELRRFLYGPSDNCRTSAVRVYVRRIRQALGNYSCLLSSHRGRGYRVELSY